MRWCCFKLWNGYTTFSCVAKFIKQSKKISSKDPQGLARCEWRLQGCVHSKWPLQRGIILDPCINLAPDLWVFQPLTFRTSPLLCNHDGYFYLACHCLMRTLRNKRINTVRNTGIHNKWIFGTPKSTSHHASLNFWNLGSHHFCSISVACSSLPLQQSVKARCKCQLLRKFSRLCSTSTNDGFFQVLVLRLSNFSRLTLVSGDTKGRNRSIYLVTCFLDPELIFVLFLWCSTCLQHLSFISAGQGHSRKYLQPQRFTANCVSSPLTRLKLDPNFWTQQ